MCLQNCIDVAGQLQSAQVIEKMRIEQRFAIVAALRRKVIHFGVRELELAQEIDGSRQSASHGELPGKRVCSKSDVKHRLMVGHSGLEITACHRDLVKIGR